MQPIELKPNHIVTGPLLPEPVKIIALVPMGDSVKLIGEGMHSGKVHQPVLTVDQIADLEVSPEKEPFDGDAAKFRLGIEAIRLGLAYEYDPYFSLSIARVDPLPHQLEAVYDYFLNNNVTTISLNYPPLHAEKFFNFLASKYSGENIHKWLGNISKIYYHHESYNNIFETVTRNYGIDMIDIRSRFLKDDNLEDLIGIDGMHPGTKGHELIYRTITDHLLTKAIGKNSNRVA